MKWYHYVLAALALTVGILVAVKELTKNCEITEWVESEKCFEQDDGTFRKKKTREVTGQPGEFGEACPSDEEMEEPGTVCEPTPCEVSEFEETKPCAPKGRSAKYFRELSREVLKEPKYGGEACPPQEEMVMEEFCEPVPCQVGKWTEWSDCQDAGEVWISRRTRKNKEPKYGGEACPLEEDVKVCRPVPCEVEWKLLEDEYGPSCTYDNDGGFKEVYEGTVVQESKYGGEACPKPHELIREEECVPKPGLECEVFYRDFRGRLQRVRDGITNKDGVCVEL